MVIKIALTALAITLVASVIVTFALLRRSKKQIDALHEDPDRLLHEKDWEEWDSDPWKNDMKDEWNDWNLWMEMKDRETNDDTYTTDSNTGNNKYNSTSDDDSDGSEN